MLLADDDTNVLMSRSNSDGKKNRMKMGGYVDTLDDDDDEIVAFASLLVFTRTKGSTAHGHGGAQPAMHEIEMMTHVR